MEQLFDNLSEIKEQLFDAPTEVKTAFNDVVGYFDDKGMDKLTEKFRRDGYLKVSEMAKLERLQGYPDGTINQARKSKIPQFDSMIVLDMEEGPGSQLSSSPVHKASKLKKSIWTNGQKSPDAVWINQFTTEDGIVYYEIVDTYYRQIVCKKSDLSKLLNGTPVRSFNRSGKGGGKVAAHEEWERTYFEPKYGKYRK